MTNSSTIDTEHIKAAFFDIDGTLVSFTTHTVPQSTIDALQGLKDKGIKLFICSGRPPSQMDVVLDTIPVAFDGIVGLNGQYCLGTDGFKEKVPLEQGDIDTITNWLDEHTDVAGNYSEENYCYFYRTSQVMREGWARLGKSAPPVYMDNPHERTPKHETFQISIYVDKATEDQVVAMCQNVRGVRWSPDFVDLIPANGGKDKGMERFLKHYGWNASQSIAFGDGGNDEDMLRYAGLGVAMGNAVDETKAVADYVTGDADHDGIMSALQHFGIL